MVIHAAITATKWRIVMVRLNGWHFVMYSRIYQAFAICKWLLLQLRTGINVILWFPTNNLGSFAFVFMYIAHYHTFTIAL
jgi:hypothetical protein